MPRLSRIDAKIAAPYPGSRALWPAAKLWRQPAALRYAGCMEKLRNVIHLAIWIGAAAFAAFRIGTSDMFMLGLIEGLMVLIAAFVAHETLDLVIMTGGSKDDD